VRKVLLRAVLAEVVLQWPLTVCQARSSQSVTSRRSQSLNIRRPSKIRTGTSVVRRYAIYWVSCRPTLMTRGSILLAM